MDAVVEAEDMKDHEQCVGCDYDGAMTGDFRIPLSSLEYPPLSAKKIIDQRFFFLNNISFQAAFINKGRNNTFPGDTKTCGIGGNPDGFFQ